MLGRLTVLIFVLLFTMGLELYAYTGLRSLFPEEYYLTFNIVYLAQLLLVLFAHYAVYNGIRNLDILRSDHVHFMVGVLFTSIITKLVFVCLLFMEDSGRALWGLGTYIASLFYDNVSPGIPERRTFLTLSAALISAIPFSTVIYGLSIGKYRFRVKELDLAFDDLPKNFNGFKIVQLSDIHAGSFKNIRAVVEGLNKVNELNPDVILITGDLVNADKDEIDPFIEAFSLLNARYGKYAVLGNHDYYGIPGKRGGTAYMTYMDAFKDKFSAMGFQLLNNESRAIEINGQRVQIVGVENWGAAPYFQKYGDLDKALINKENGVFNVLMSHDPSHWDSIIRDHEKKVQLTLSGHTHGMQFGIDLPWLTWSPVKYTYKYWMGLYHERDQYLYVNRGFGYLGLPGRVGIWPEITKITLHAT